MGVSKQTQRASVSDRGLQGPLDMNMKGLLYVHGVICYKLCAHEEAVRRQSSWNRLELSYHDFNSEAAETH